MNKPEVFELTKHERDSAVWKKLEAHYKAKLELRRTQNDSDKSAEETAKLRGRISEIKELLGLGQDSDG